MMGLSIPTSRKVSDMSPTQPEAKLKTTPAESGRVLEFVIGTVEPPKMKRGGKRDSKYAPPEQVPHVWTALVGARKAKDAETADSAWVSAMATPVETEVKVRNALKAMRDAVAAHATIPEKALAGRVWNTAEDQWFYAIQIRPGVLPTEGN